MHLLLVIASIFCAVVPMVFFLGLLWLSDRYDREPLWLVLLTFVWGATGAVFIALPLNTAFSMFASGFGGELMIWLGLPFDWTHLISPILGAPLFEEPAKALFLLFLAWNRRPHDMSSGFLYGAAAGLGFGMSENFMYFTGVAVDPQSWMMTVTIRTFYSALLHAMASSVVGAAFGFARLRGFRRTVLYTGLGLCIAMGLHGLFNGLLSFDELSVFDLRTANFVLLPLEVLFVLFVWQVTLFDDSLSIRRELEEEEDTGVLPKDQSWKLASWWRRMFTDIIPPGVERARYIQTATALARRKRQLKLLGDRSPAFYRDDVRRLRRQLILLLETHE